uniref:Si:ch211-241j12.3 n=2 Tax=Astyanax mexicanus TaxID=7994 RepID=A0A3B1JQL8_ASTMX
MSIFSFLFFFSPKGTFDQHGCPLVMFPTESQDKLVSDLTKEEVADFISYFLRLHSKNKEECLVSVVADLREANLSIARRVAESLLLLELHRRTVHSVYVVQPRKRDALKLLQKLLLPKKASYSPQNAYKCVFLKEVCELWNYIDRSQLTASLGGYLVYCHSSWVSFVKEIDSFVQQFVAVVQRLPVCISALQSISALPVPADPSRLSQFCSSNQAELQQIRSDLGLDELLRRCECVLEKFRFPESDQCYQAMVGTHLYTHTALEMLHNYERITAAVEKVELLWQQAFSKARGQLQLLNLQKEAQQVESQMDLVWQKLQSFSTETAADGGSAETLKLEFEASVYTHAMALVRRAEDVIHTLVENVGERSVGEQWVVELEQQKERFRSAVELQYSNIRTHCLFHQLHNKIQSWYSLAVCESFLQDLLWVTCCTEQDSQGDVSAGREWRPALESFLRVHTCPQVEELVQLAHLANVISDPQLQNAGKQLAHRCMNLRKLLTSPGSATLRDLQLALQWQYEYLKGSRETVNSDLIPRRNESTETVDSERSVQRDSGFVSIMASVRPSSSHPDLNKQDCVKNNPLRSAVLPDAASLAGKPPSLSSFDSGFEGAGGGQIEGKEGQDGLPRMPYSRETTSRLKVPQLQISEENVSSMSDSEDLDHGTAGSNSTTASIHIIPRITSDSLNFEIKVQRSATLPKNPWLSLPVDNLESSYTVTISPSSPALQRPPKCHSPSEHCRDQPTQTDSQGCGYSTKQQDHEGSFREGEFSPIRNVLSSTMAEGGDQADGTTDVPHTLLWDTYDLHDVRQDTSDRLSDISLGNWELEEQKELQAVEEILGRTAGILQEEENVLAQEVALDVLLKADHVGRQWPSWNHMSSSELAEAGVIGLEDDPTSPLRFNCRDSVSSSRPNSEAISPAEQLLQPDRSRVLQELEDLQVLEERIMEENMKIQELRLSEKTPESRRKFLEELEREKKEVEEMERSLRRETKKKREGKPKKRSQRGPKVVKCSIMEMTMALQSFEDEDAVCDEALLMNCRRETQESKSLQSNSRHLDTATDGFISCLDSGQSCTAMSVGLATEEFGHSIDVDQFHEDYTKSVPSNSALDEIVHFPDKDQPHEPPDLITEDSTSSRPSNSGLREIINCESSNQPCASANFSTTEESTNSSPSNLIIDKLIDCVDSDQLCEPQDLTTEDSSLSRPSDSPLDELINCAVSEQHRKTPDLTTEESTSFGPSDLSPSKIMECADSNQNHEQPLQLTTEDSSLSRPLNPVLEEIIQDLNQIVLDSHCKDAELGTDPPLIAITKKPTNNDLYLSVDQDEDKQSIHSSPSKTDGDVFTPGNSLITHTGSQMKETGQQMDTSKSGMNENPSEIMKESWKTDESESQSGDLKLMEACQERAAFDPGGPKPHPRLQRMKKPLMHSGESSVSELNLETCDHHDEFVVTGSTLLPSAGPKPKERKNLPPRIYPSAAEHNRNNNNPRCADLYRLDAETFLQEPAVEYVEYEAVDHTDVDIVSQISETESHGVCNKSAAKVTNTRIDEEPSTRTVCTSPALHQQLQICSREASEFLTPVVLDTGSGLVKAGFADQDLPSLIFPTAIGVPKYEEVMSSSVQQAVYVGHDAQHMRGVLTLHYPMKNGIIDNWDQIEMIWQHVFRQLGVDPEDHPVLLTEGVLNPQGNRQRMVQTMFETFNVPLTFIALQPVLALYAAGRTTGVVFDSGDGVSHSVPVFDGYSLPHAVQRLTLAGSDVTMQLKKLLLEQGVCMRTSAELEIVRDIKERCCCVALDFEVQLSKGGGASTPTHYTLPDGQIVSLTTERFRAPEILFKPELIGRDHYGIHESIFRSVLQSDIDLRKSFLGNIVLSGGNTLLAGLPERLQVELGNLAPATECVKVISAPDRDFSVWKGGAVLSSLPTFSSAWISRDEYEEFGPNIVNRRCF